MDISQGVVFGMIAMFAWGASDIFIAHSARGGGTFRAFLWSQIISISILTAAFFGFYKLPALSAESIAIILVAGVFGVIANLAFYKSLEVGKVSITMPVASCWAIVTVILSISFLGEKLTALQAAGVLFAVLGAVLVSFELSDILKIKLKNYEKGVEYAIVAAIAYGIDFVLIDILVSKIGWFLSIFLMGTATAVYLVAYSKAVGRNVSFPKNVISSVILVAILDTIAYLAYGAGVTSEYGAIVAPIGAASPAVGVTMARIFLKERMEANQKIGVVSVLAGLILLAT